MHHPLDSNIQRTGIFVCFCPLVYPWRQELVLGTGEEAILICFKKILSDLREENFSKFKDRSDSKRLYNNWIVQKMDERCVPLFPNLGQEIELLQ